MVRNIIALFALVAAIAVSIDAAAVPGGAILRERPGFIFLGTIKKDVQVTVNGITSVSTKDFNYWLSVNAAGYAEAQRDCRANTDELLQIETIEERDEVESFLQDTDQTASRVWVGGKYQVGSKSFTWENGQAVVDELWGAGQPSQSKPNSRIAADIVGQIVSLRAQANTVTTRYICEGQ